MLGNLVHAFNFRHKPRKPLILPTLPAAAFRTSGVPGALGTLLAKLGP
jgi:hypothetical protein